MLGVLSRLLLNRGSAPRTEDVKIAARANFYSENGKQALIMFSLMVVVQRDFDHDIKKKEKLYKHLPSFVGLPWWYLSSVSLRNQK